MTGSVSPNVQAQQLRREQLKLQLRQVSDLLSATINGTDKNALGAGARSFVSEGTAISPRRMEDSHMATTIQPFISNSDRIAAITTA